MTSAPKISIIIPNLNSPILDQVLDALFAQSCQEEFEVVVVGQDLFGKAKADSRINFIETPTPISSASARNLGARSSRGDLIAFLDADCIVDPGWLQSHLDMYSTPDVNIVGGGVNFLTSNYWVLCDNISSFHEHLTYLPGGYRDILPSLNLSLRRSVWADVGEFDENFPFPAGEDADFSIRARINGYQLVFHPKALITHRPNRTKLSLITKKAFLYGQYSIKIIPKYRPLQKHSFLFKNAALLLLLSPVLALSVVTKIVFVEKLPLQFWHTLPTILFLKIAWCFGAAKRLRALKNI